MTKDIINKIQIRVLNLLNEHDKSDLKLLSQANCSELSRLVGCWLLKIDDNLTIWVYKGEGGKVIGEDMAHDLLVVSDSEKSYWIIDPTIWQYFPEVEKILVGKFNNIIEVSNRLEGLYGGNWNKSEQIAECNQAKMNEWQRIIEKNIGLV